MGQYPFRKFYIFKIHTIVLDNTKFVSTVGDIIYICIWITEFSICRSKSGDTLLAGDPEIVTNLEAENPVTTEQSSRDTILHVDDNYYSLLEENMYLLDQLKEKEEICSHLQNELDRLDDKTEKTNRTHQEEMGMLFYSKYMINLLPKAIYK